MRKRTADPRAAYGAAQADLLPIKYMVRVYARDCACFGLQPEQRVQRSAQSFAPRNKLQEVATTHIFLRNDGNNLLTHKLEET